MAVLDLPVESKLPALCLVPFPPLVRGDSHPFAQRDQTIRCQVLVVFM